MKLQVSFGPSGVAIHWHYNDGAWEGATLSDALVVAEKAIVAAIRVDVAKALDKLQGHEARLRLAETTLAG